MAMKKESDVQNAPGGWKGDITFVNRQVHLTEPPSALENPYAAVQVEQNVIDLDPGDFGTATNTINLEVRADSIGTLAVGPISLGADARRPRSGRRGHAPGAGQDQGRQRPRTGQVQLERGRPGHVPLLAALHRRPELVPKFTYQVRVIVKGSIFAKGQEWLGTPQEMSSSGPLIVTVPTPDDPGVTKKDIVFKGVAAPRRAGALPAAPHDGHGPPAAVSAEHGGPPSSTSRDIAKKGPPASVSPARTGDGGPAGWESREINPRELAGWGTAPPGKGGGY